jgi:hypothetical protein
MVTNAAQVYHEFAQSLRLHLGKIPNSGLPRISRMKPGQSRFTATDPSGNSVIFITLDEKDDEIYNEPDKSGLTALQKSVALAIRLRDFKNDNAAAVKVLDKALKHTGQEKKIDIAQALWIRAELANEMEESLHENDYYTELKKIFLTKEEIDSLRKKLNTIDEIGHFFAD